MARPTKYNAKLSETICTRIMEGQGVREIGRDDNMPDASTIFVWLAKHQEFQELYTRAKEVQADAFEEELLEIADDSSNDYMKRQNADGTAHDLVDNEHINRSRLRIETRKWVMSKLKPRKYGDYKQIDQNISGKLTVEKLTDKELDEQIADLTKK